MKNPRESGDFFIEASTQKRWYKTIYLKFFAILQYLSLQLLKNLYIIFNNRNFFCFFGKSCFHSYKKICISFSITEVSFAYFSFQRKVG